MGEMKRYIIQAAVIIAAVIAVIYKNLSYEYTMAGDAISVLDEHYGGADGYVSEDIEGGGKKFEAVSGDPQFFLKFNEGQRAGGIELVFDECAAETPIQVFYSKTADIYSEKCSFKTVMPDDDTSVSMPMRLGTYTDIRIDIDGDFSLKEIKIYQKRAKTSIYISNDDKDTCILWCILATVIPAAVFCAHNIRQRELGIGTAKYISNMLVGSKPAGGHMAHMDYLRVLAVFLVILTHVCSSVSLNEREDWQRFILWCGEDIGLACNPIYIMLSGALLLGRRSNSVNEIGEFYLKRVVKVVIPLVLYSLMTIYAVSGIIHMPMVSAAEAARQVLEGDVTMAEHMWLIYVIISLYITAPFFQIMVKNLSRKNLISLTVITFAVNTVVTYLPLFGIKPNISNFMSGWEGTFLLGYVLVRQDEEEGRVKRENIMIISSALVYAITVFIVFMHEDMMSYVFLNSPTNVIVACGVFSVFLKYKDWFNGKLNLFIRFIVKYNYSIILIHVFVLIMIVQYKFNINALSFGCIGGIPATFLITLAISAVGAVIIDNTVVIVFDVLFDKTVGLFKKIACHS